MNKRKSLFSKVDDGMSADEIMEIVDSVFDEIESDVRIARDVLEAIHIDSLGDVGSVANDLLSLADAIS